MATGNTTDAAPISADRRALRAERRRSAARLRTQLRRRPAAERAFFDASPLSLPMLALVAAIWGTELYANALRGEGWSALAHALVIAPLELLVLVALWRGTRAAWWHWQLARTVGSLRAHWKPRASARDRSDPTARSGTIPARSNEET